MQGLLWLWLPDPAEVQVLQKKAEIFKLVGHWTRVLVHLTRLLPGSAPLSLFSAGRGATGLPLLASRARG